MSFQVKQIGPGQYRLQGSMDMASLSADWAIYREKKHLLLPDQQQLSLDLAAVEPIDSAGLAWLINMLRDCGKENIQLRLCNVPQSLLKLAKISNVDHFLPLQ